jgi:4-hydroxy-tetrahydrodipicolinate reductase
MLRAGNNVLSSGPVFLQYPYGVVDESMYGDLLDAAAEGGVSLHVNGVDPGFANDILPLVMTSVCEEIEEVRVAEVLNYATYDQGMILFDVMGFGKPMDEVPFLLQPGILTTAWGSVVRQMAAALEVELDDELEEWYERVAAPEAITVSAGTIEAGTVAGMHFEVRGLKDGRPVIVLEHVTRLRDDLAPEWPQPAGQGCYRVTITGEPTYTVDMQMMGRDGDHNTGGLKATAMRLVNAIPAVVDAEPGLVAAKDLPQVVGKGLII